MNSAYEAIIIGAGPAGLSAAHMLGRARRSVLVIDAGQPRNRFADRMHGILASGTGQEVSELATALASADSQHQQTLATFPTAAFTQGTPEERHRWALGVLLDGITLDGITHRRP